MPNDLDLARDALYSIPADLARDDWVKAGMGFHAAGGDFDTFDNWSASAPSYNAQDCRAMWKSIKPGRGISEGTLYRMAADNGLRIGEDKSQRQAAPALRKTSEPPRKADPGMSAADVWNRCQPATYAHPYIVKKKAAGVPLDNLRVLPAGDTLSICGEPMAGSLVVPVYRADGSLSTLQFITPPEVAARLKAKRKSDKLNLPGTALEGWHAVGELRPGCTIYVAEHIGGAWTCWQATGDCAVGCFGSGRMRTVALALRALDESARLVFVADVGMEEQARAIAKEVNGFVVTMPPGWPQNSDVNDFAQCEGNDAVAELLESPKEPPKPVPRYKLLGADDLRRLPALKWRVRGVLPTLGLAGLFGPSGCGKTFLTLDLAAAIAEAYPWFGYRVEAAPVIYAVLEGEAGFKLRVAAWEAHRGRALPDGLSIVMQPFELTNPQDVADLIAVVPRGAVVFIDTLNRAAPTADENSSKDMGEILSAAKLLQSLINGLVVLVHHTGKDTSKGLRGHSSLFAALDAAIEVSRDGDRREWKVVKSKDGQDGYAQPFKLQIETLGTDDYGDAVTSCVVVQDNTAQEVRTVKLPQGGNQRLVLDALRPMFKDGTTGKPGAPPLRPCIELEAAVTAGASRLTCPSDKRTSRTREAITGLVSRGFLGLNNGFLWTV